MKTEYIDGTEIEIVNPNTQRGSIRYAIFDNDGTISVLREGWEQVMEPVMIKSILGERFHDIDDATYNRVKKAVQVYIDESTGIQTILQMEHLVEMVKDFGFVPDDKIRDKHGYKSLYNEELMRVVNERLRKISTGELSPTDFLVKGAREILEELNRRRVKMYLASGTDREDVVHETGVLGVDTFFKSIYGSVGDVAKYSKKIIVDKLIEENSLSGPELAVFGDGPVEIREVKRVGGIAVGVASDEVRRFGVNSAKRERLIRAGADIIIGDFTQMKKLMSYLFEPVQQALHTNGE